MNIPQELLDFITKYTNNSHQDLSLEFLNDYEGSGEVSFGVKINAWNKWG